MVEFVMFLRTKAHRNPADILKSFIRAASTGSTNATVKKPHCDLCLRLCASYMYEMLNSAPRDWRLIKSTFTR